MKPTVYVETSIIGYLAMRMSNVLRVAANQQVTREWWDNHRQWYDVFVSGFVVDECAAGDPRAAADRLSYLQGIPLLEVGDEGKALATALQARVPMPEKAAVDAAHISVATVSSIEYLMTWNCRHIANPTLRKRIDAVCRDMGYRPPVICTPHELLEMDDEF